MAKTIATGETFEKRINLLIAPAGATQKASNGFHLMWGKISDTRKCRRENSHAAYPISCSKDLRAFGTSKGAMQALLPPATPQLGSNA
jgi:hypothetical protein